MRLVLRADASVTIGTGHVMRCLTLARALRDLGNDCAFVCRDLPGHLGARIGAEGFALTLLPAPAPGFQPAADDPAHAIWAGVQWALDAAQTLAAAGQADWLVVDHYAFDARWQDAARPPLARLMVIDDLADRHHAADLLLDQNLGRRSADYDALMPAGAERLIGPRHALLRPEFAALRATTLATRVAAGHPLRRVLVSMGGVDQPNATGAALAALAALPGLEAVVVMGAAAPALEAVRAQAAALPFPVDLHVDVPDMAALMAGADLAIGAAGGTAWERCALGLPTLLAVLADNQTAAAAALAASGAALDLGRADAPGFADALSRALAEVQRPGTLQALSEAAAAVTDGKGAARVAAVITQPLRLRPATMAEAEAIWHWRRAVPESRFRSGPTPPMADHLNWFATALADPGRHLLVAGDPPFAHLRLDEAGDGRAAVSILLAPDAQGRGLGRRLLALLADAARAQGLHGLLAQVHRENAASLALFRAAGYRPAGTENGFASFRLSL